jgi:hypothetical protein
MRVQIGDKTLVISWMYVKSEIKLASMDTICKISEVQADGSLAEMTRGIASCSLTDQFRKEPGRKLSLQRAVLTKIPNEYGKWNYLFLEEDRVKIYQQYFQSRGAEMPKELVR